MARGPAPNRGKTNAGGEHRAESVVGQGTRVRGHVRGEGDVRILGQVEGDVAIEGDLAIESSGGITGDVSAHAVTIRGGLTGDVTARGAVAILSGSNVTGNMGGAEVSLEEGAVFSGRIEAEFDLPPELTARAGR